MKIDKELNDKIDKFIDHYKNKIILDICELVKIKSVSEDNTDTLPFGEGCRKVLDKALKISSDMGFEIDNCDYYCGSASLNHNDKRPHIGFWGHLDVVPEGQGWNYPPYSPTLHEGYLVGRGVSDNKGPTICALYTLLFFKESNYNLKYNYKVIFGTNEENGMEDVEYYLKNRKSPVFSIIADSVFPICYAEKGIFRGEIEIPFFYEDMIDMSGGTVCNAVADRAEIRLKKTDYIENLESPINITIEANEDYQIISSKGIASHAAHPEGSRNAIHILTSYLRDVVQDERSKESLRFIADLTDTFNGEGLGIEYSDDVSGELTCIVGLMSYRNNKINLSIDIRYPISTNVEEMVKKIKERCHALGAKLINTKDSKPCYVDPKNEMVVILNDFYNEFMGTDIQPYYEGGGSYARKVPNSLAFGPILHVRKPKPSSLAHGGAHKADESLCIDELLLALKIYILTILKIDCIDVEVGKDIS